MRLNQDGQTIRREGEEGGNVALWWFSRRKGARAEGD